MEGTADNTISVEVDGIPVAIDARRIGKMSIMRKFAQTMDETLDDMTRAIASFDWAQSVLGDEQFDNVKWSIDPDEGDPDGQYFVGFVTRCIAAASEQRAADPKN